MEASRSNKRKGMLERRRERASRRDAMPAPEMRIGFGVMAGRLEEDRGEGDGRETGVKSYSQSVQWRSCYTTESRHHRRATRGEVGLGTRTLLVKQRHPQHLHANNAASLIAHDGVNVKVPTQSCRSTGALPCIGLMALNRLRRNSWRSQVRCRL
jgi:hypothetical protein